MQDSRLVRERSGEKIFATDEGLHWMQENGLDSLDDVASFRGGVVANARKHGCVRRCEGPDGRPVFLKVYEEGRPSWLRRLRHPPSPARAEVLNMKRVREAGVSTPDVLAWGEDRRGRSFLLTSAARGRSLADLWEEGWRPSGEERDLVAQAVIAAHEKLARAGWMFEDFVPKHLFLDLESSEPEVTLIDLCRMSPAGADERCLEPVLARLAAEAPRHCVSLAERLRFLIRLHPDEDRAAVLKRFRRLDERVWKFYRKRKYRRHLLTRPIPPFPLKAFDAQGRLAYDPRRRPFLESLGVDFDRPDHIDGLALDGAAGAVLHRGETSGIRLLFHVHYVLAGWVALPDVMARYLARDEDGLAWLLVAGTRAEPLDDALSRAEPSPALVGEFTDALAALVFMGVLPEAPIASWFRVERGGRLCVTPTEGFRLALPEERPAAAREFVSGLNRELADSGVGADRRALLLERLVLERRQLLGGKRRIGEGLNP